MYKKACWPHGSRLQETYGNGENARRNIETRRRGRDKYVEDAIIFVIIIKAGN